MSLLDKIFGPLIKPVTDLVSEVVVDKDKARELNVRLQELADKADERYHEAMMGQIEVNKVEAAHSSIFVAGWRPAVGWTGAAGLAYASILRPIADWIARIAGYTGELPQLDTTMLMTVLMGILGIGGFRTIEKVKGVARTTLKDG